MSAREKRLGMQHVRKKFHFLSRMTSISKKMSNFAAEKELHDNARH